MYSKRFMTILLILLATRAHAGALSPVKNWRAIPVSVSASSSQESLSPLGEGKDASWTPNLGRSEWLEFQFPKGKAFLFTFSCAPGKTTVYAVLEHPQNGGWQTEDVIRLAKGRLYKFRLDRSRAESWRVRFTFRAKAEPSRYEVADIALHSLDAPGRKDYWLMVGASIEAMTIRQKTFRDMVVKRFPEYDPVMFNLGVGGWKAEDLLKALPGFLKNHPDASYVCIHIGGNNVTPNRPYPGGAENLRTNLTAILEMIKDSGKIPIMARLTYRAYKNVPPEENGSGPYDTHVYDPLIKQYCPDFVDPRTGVGVVDGYGWFKAHPDELRPEGVHLTDKGGESWNRLWAEGAGRVIYR
jgi:lysophospholipase L1-like esterase